MHSGHIVEVSIESLEAGAVKCLYPNGISSTCRREGLGHAFRENLDAVIMVQTGPGTETMIRLRDVEVITDP